MAALRRIRPLRHEAVSCFAPPVTNSRTSSRVAASHRGSANISATGVERVTERQVGVARVGPRGGT